MCPEYAQAIFGKLPEPGKWIETHNVNTVPEPERVVSAILYDNYGCTTNRWNEISSHHPGVEKLEAWQALYKAIGTSYGRTWTSDGCGGGSWDREIDE